MTPSSAERLDTESYNRLMSRKTAPSKIIEILPTTITIDIDGIGDTVLIDLPTMASPEKYAERKLVYTPYEPVDERDNKI